MPRRFVLQQEGHTWFLVPERGTEPRYPLSTSVVRNTSQVLNGQGTDTDALNALLRALQVGHTHEQTTAALVWHVAHMLGYRPNVQASDDVGDVRRPNIHHVDDNHVDLIFTTPTKGFARCV